MYVSDEFCEFRARSFYVEGQKICEVVLLFFKLEKMGWISLSIGEGLAIFSHGLQDTEYQLSEGVDEEFAYPVRVVGCLLKYVGKKISRIYEYRMEGVDEGCVGVYFDCERDGFSVLEDDGCLKFSDGICSLGDDVSLVIIDR
ncbi:hypothetical protein [Pseudomonas sp. WC2]|jgi:hypothetical protein|uniref:hypothetical protein n=1 Tax=Pseudomonas sp. WC2 TaxID=3424773 RepID=UPI003D3258D4